MSFISCCQCFYEKENVKSGVEDTVSAGKEGEKVDDGGGTTKRKGRGGVTAKAIGGPGTEASGEKEQKDGNEERRKKIDEIEIEKESSDEEIETIVKLTTPPPPSTLTFLSTHSSKPLRTLPPTSSANKDGGGGTIKEKGSQGGTEKKIDGLDSQPSLNKENEKKEIYENEETEESEKEKGKEEKLLENGNDGEKESANEEAKTVVELMPPPSLSLPPLLSTRSSKPPLRALQPTALWRYSKENANGDVGDLTTKEKVGEGGIEGKINGLDTESSREEKE